MEQVPAPAPPLGVLPISGQPPAERADAARNRRKILAAAAGIVAAEGVEGLALDDVARAAGVGVGTVYRRFGDRAGLIFALLDERESEFQAAFVSGPPPLGPGAPPVERIRAFLHALVDRVEDQTDLLLVAETSSPGARYRSGTYSLHHTHLVTLLAQLKPDADTHYLADALLAPLAANLLSYQRRVLGITVERIKAGLDELLRLSS